MLKWRGSATPATNKQNNEPMSENRFPWLTERLGPAKQRSTRKRREQEIS